MSSKRKSYTNGAKILTKIREAAYHSRFYSNGADDFVRHRTKVMEDLADTLRRRHQLVLTGLDVLDVGTGQQQVQSVWLARNNRVTGIDLDVVAKGWSPAVYLGMWRRNGPGRVLKTLGRKALGIDARFRAALRRQLAHTADGLPVLQMDVTQLGFAEESFDFVYCSSVLQCVPDVGRALYEMNRVLRRGGVGYFTVQLFSSETGSLDPRLFGNNRDEIPHWAHLRPDWAHLVSGEAWLNRLRLADWRQQVAAHLPDPTIDLGQPQAEKLIPLAEQLKRAGELADYSMEELITHDLKASWRKPQAQDPR
ncbi:MAG: class I SAM-dependent methyltransferase [Burkholderiales bacterium]|nr:MAG: class I SAM-dependent methyltransferase [Burkholderiales bacterium]